MAEADPIRWREAKIRAITPATTRVKSFRFDAFARPHRAGQHVDVRLTAPDGYQAQRSYSIASAPGDPLGLELMIERLTDGEVSGFFDTVAEVGDTIEMRGPVGAFAWEAGDGGPVLLVGGGSGVVPLLAMVRERALTAPDVPMLLLYSVRNAAEAIARGELSARSRDETGFDLTLLLTREGPTAGRRIDRVMIDTAIECLGMPRHSFVCGSNAFVGAVADLLVDAGVRPVTIRTERFGG
ncbi:ferredoxin-NADP reductase [Methylorubrum rhodinum]|uniref:Ferredoxin-NADP reductase n=1 Tax=Methylorubrum rhodinum TaxID=29428 RepID=A0A840ZIS1_9HYPH|nr:FAD-binding oxidoreductase [Methylorubrum rhodinum]MBB5757038.1 ferredoxin-NADP reductase [Methylorubrum rhodinum]